MHGQHQWWSVLVAAVLGGLVGVTAVAAGEQFLPVLSRREGALRFTGIPLTDGYIAYLTLVNACDGGIHGVPLVWEECEIVYDVDRGVECYERLKGKGPTGAAVFHPLNTPLVYALLERATQDQISLISMGIGRSDTADGRVFPYVFPAPANAWSQNTAKIRFIGQRAGGMDQLKGWKIAHVYHDSEYGRETLPILDTYSDATKESGVWIAHSRRTAAFRPASSQQQSRIAWIASGRVANQGGGGTSRRRHFPRHAWGGNSGESAGCGLRLSRPAAARTPVSTAWPRDCSARAWRSSRGGP